MQTIVGNKAKGWISKRLFQENKARQIFRKTKISNPLIPIRKWAYQEVRNSCFSENFPYFILLKQPFWDSPFYLITDAIGLFAFNDIYHVYISLWLFLCKPRLTKQKLLTSLLNISSHRISMTLEGASQIVHASLWWYARHLNHQYKMVTYTKTDAQTACHIHIPGFPLVWKVLTEKIDNRRSYLTFLNDLQQLLLVQTTRARTRLVRKFPEKTL